MVSAVGHEIDFTIADFVADKRAPTPSAAAEMLSPDQAEFALRLRTVEQSLARQLRRQLRLLHAQRHGVSGRLRHPGERLREQAQRLDDLELHLRRALRLNLQQRQHRLGLLKSRLQGQAPTDLLRQLATETGHLAARARHALKVRLDHQQHALALLETRLTAISPRRTMERGYAIVLDSEGTLVQDASAIKPGDLIETRLKSGSLSSEVRETRPAEKPDS